MRDSNVYTGHQMIPSKGGRQIGEFLHAAAAECPSGTAIVELGTWFGAGTHALASGAPAGVQVHTYDRFRITQGEKQAAAYCGIKIHGSGDLLTTVKGLLSDAGDIVYHKGEITQATWEGPEIAVYADDACKRRGAFTHAIRTFSPWWFPGTVVVLMDYYWHRRHVAEPDAQVQPEFVAANRKRLEFLRDWDGLSCVAFRYVGGKLTY